jgi:cellulose synthase (UDP-forming)
MLNPKLGKFNVTQKGSQQDGRFDSAMARPFLVLLLLNLIGLGLAVMRYLYWNTDHRDTVIVNAIWVLFNMIILGVTVAVCLEKRQRRGSNPTSVLKTLNLLILGMTALQEIQ